MEHVVLYIHIFFLCIAGVGVLLADASAVGWLRGKREVVNREAVMLAHGVVSVGLAGLIGSGLYLFWPMRAYLVGQPLFWVKMGFVAALVINSFAIEYMMHTAARRSFTSMSTRERLPFIVSGAISTLSWIGAFLVAITLF